MHIEKQKIPYIFLVLLCTGYIPFALWPFFEQDNASVYINISIYDIFLIFMGLIFMGTTVWIALNIWKYTIGKVFVMYLFCVSAGILIHFLPGTYPVYNKIIVFAFLCISNIFLYRIICQLINASDGRFYQIIDKTLVAATIFHIVFFITDIYTGTDSSLLISIYLVTAGAISIILISTYQGADGYLRKQILSIFKKLAIGLILFLLTGFVSVLEFNIQTNSPQEKTIIYNDVSSPENLSTTGEDQLNILPVIIYAFIVVTIIYMLVKKEYLAELSAPKLSKLLLIIILFWFFDFLVLLVFLPGIGMVCVMNGFPAASYMLSLRKTEPSQDDSEILIEEEQHRISALLHDDILQNMFALKNKLAGDKQAEADIQLLIAKVRELSNDLHPLVVENLGLHMSLNMLIKDLSENNNVSIVYENDCAGTFLTLPREVALYRFAKEFITNAIKHAKCMEIIVRLCVEDNRIKLMVKDNGKGIEMDGGGQKWIMEHTGLKTIDKRAAQFGGVLKIHSTREKGTECTVELPLVGDISI